MDDFDPGKMLGKMVKRNWKMLVISGVLSLVMFLVMVYAVIWMWRNV